MGSLLYIPGKTDQSPYCNLFDNALWEDVQDTFTRDACARLGLSVDSPLAVWYILINSFSIRAYKLFNFHLKLM